MSRPSRWTWMRKTWWTGRRPIWLQHNLSSSWARNFLWLVEGVRVLLLSWYCYCRCYCYCYCDYGSESVSFYRWWEGVGLLLPWTPVIPCLVDSHNMILKIGLFIVKLTSSFRWRDSFSLNINTLQILKNWFQYIWQKIFCWKIISLVNPKKQKIEQTWNCAICAWWWEEFLGMLKGFHAKAYYHLWRARVLSNQSESAAAAPADTLSLQLEGNPWHENISNQCDNKSDTFLSEKLRIEGDCDSV